jgi:hypothetical protein
LVAALRCQPIPAAAATAIDRLPEHSLALRDLAEVVTSQAVDHYRALAEAHIRTSICPSWPRR